MIVFWHVLGIVNMYYVIQGGSWLNLIGVGFCLWSIHEQKTGK
jgi:hypothetical protein